MNDTSTSDSVIIRENERRYNRVEPHGQTAVRIRMERSATVVDASSGGVGLMVDHPWGFNLNDHVLLCSEDDNMEPIDYAIVKNVALQPDGTWRIGLEWLTEKNQ